MTIAIGYLCFNGVVVAADTAVVVGQADLQEGSKLDVLYGKGGTFAIVNSSNDANATATLLADITDDLRAHDLKNYRDLEKLLKRQMTDWRRAFGARKPTETQLILGAKLFGQRAKLFLCQPPNTVREIDNYVASGWGSAVTDPLQVSLFGNNGGDHTDVQFILRRIAYLVYRAKKDNIYCGKKTECAVVGRDDVEPVRVDPDDMAEAERVSSGLDFLLSSTAIFALESSDDTIERHAEDLADMLRSSSFLRQVVFHDYYRNEVKL